MTEVQEYLLKLIKEIDEICLANDIEYYIFAGSMLGLERNEGFLPWDDDIDLIMTEKNYEKFMKVMRDNPPPNRVFECKETNDEYPLQFGKYMSTDMTGLIRPHSFGNASSGLWIDIVHATPAPTSERRINFIKKWFSAYCEVDNEMYILYKNHWDGFYWRYKFVLFLVSIFGKKRVDKWADKLFRSYPEDECEQYLMYHTLYTDYRFFEKKHFEKPVRRMYESEELSAAPYNREFSRVLFGDSWMMVPPMEDRDVHLMVLDFDIPYDKYVEDYMPFLDKNKILKDLNKTKVIQMKDMVKRRRYIRRKYDIKGLLLNEKMKAHLADTGIDLEQELRDGNFELFKQIYEEYETLQFKSPGAAERVFVKLDDSILYPYIKKALMYDGEYYKAAKLLAMREASTKAPLPQKMRELRPIIEICRMLSIAMWDNEDMGEVEKIINTEISCNNYEFCIDFELAKLYLMMNKASGEEDYTLIKNDIKRIMNIIPNQGECLKLLGDIEYELGNFKEAIHLYDEAEKFTSNGLLLLDMLKKREKCQ